jgi:WD40 repeat protein
MTSDEALKCLQTCLKNHPSPQSLNQLQQQVFCGCWNGKSYRAIASELNYNPNYIRQVGTKLWKTLRELIGIDINRQNFKTYFTQYCYETHQYAPQKTDWGEMPTTTKFYGRTQELEQLYQDIVRDQCRLVTILGIGGIGKSSMIAQFAQQVTGFDYIIWRSLQDAPQLSELLKQIIRFLSDQSEICLPKTPQAQINLLLKYLNQHRCLLIFDNLENILESGKDHPTQRAGVCQVGYEGYQELLQRLGQEVHQSCLLITSREKPKVLNFIADAQLPVRSWQLLGLNPAEGYKLFTDIANQQEDSTAWQQIINHYGGNPLALKLLVPIIRRDYQSDPLKFLRVLRQGTLIIDDLQALLNHQFQRLSDLEQQIMYWLAIKREAVSLPDLTTNLCQVFSRSEVLEALRSVNRRSLVENTRTGFTQQPVVQEYITQRFVKAICQELQDENLDRFRQLPLLEATTKVYLKHSQQFFILQPICQFLTRTYPNLKTKLHSLLRQLRQDEAQKTGYGIGNFINLLIHLEIPLHPYDFSGLKIWQADLQQTTLQHVNFAEAQFQDTSFLDTFGAVITTSFSHQGNLLAIGESNNEVRIYRVADGKSLHHLQGHTGWVWTVAFSPDDRILASSSDDYTVKLWDVATGDCLGTLLEHQRFVHCLVFHPDGKRLITGSCDNTIKVWDISTQTCLQTLTGHTTTVKTLAVNPAGTSLVSGSADATLKLWDLSTGECLKTLTGHELAIWSVVWSPDGQTIFSGSYDLTIRHWDATTGKCLRVLGGHKSHVFALALDPQGQYLASAGSDATIRIWDLSTYKTVQILLGHKSRIFDLSWHLHQPLLASAGQDQQVKLWQPLTGSCFHTWSGYTNSIWSLTFDSQGSILASGSDDGKIRLWNWQDQTLRQVLKGYTLSVFNLVFSPVEPLLASSGPDCLAKLWDVNTGQCMKTFPVYTPPARALAFNPQGTTLATVNRNSTIKITEIQTEKELCQLEGHLHNVSALAFTPDGKGLISGGYDNLIKVWDLKTAACVKTLVESRSAIWSIAVHPDGSICLSSSDDGTVKLWNLHTGNCLKILRGHGKGYLYATFHPHGHLIASSGLDQTVKLWDVATGECLKVLRGHGSGVVSLAFHPQDNLLASGSLDGTIKIWDLTEQVCIQTLRLRKPYEGMKIAGAKLNEAQKSNLRSLGAVD